MKRDFIIGQLTNYYSQIIIRIFSESVMGNVGENVFNKTHTNVFHNIRDNILRSNLKKPSKTQLESAHKLLLDIL